jgi:glycosyltransferase involved in cell wall biosynthesis
MISVVIPTYKSPEALDLCIKSAVEGQVVANQIIIVVDGFYNLNKPVLDKWADYVDILNLQQNVGLCRATNLGVYNAKHDKVLIVNDDNVFPKQWDVLLEDAYDESSVLTPNQIEPYPSMFSQFNIKDLGRSIDSFDLETFWQYASTISTKAVAAEGSTLPILMSRNKFIAVGGWDENYEMGMVADWDFFLKCQLMGMSMMRLYSCHFYHFVSLTTNTPDNINKRREAEEQGHQYAAYKWGTYIKHDPISNKKYL